MLCNIERARDRMDAVGMSALVTTTYEGVLYLSDFDNMLPFSTGTRAAAVLPLRADMPPTLIVAKPYLAHLVKAPTWMPDVRCFGAIGVKVNEDRPLVPPEAEVMQLLEGVGADPYPNMTAAIGAILADMGATEGIVGFDDITIVEQLPEPWTKTNTADARSLLSEVRMVKTAEEIDRLREAARINEAAFEVAAGAVHAGGQWIDVTRAWQSKWVSEGGTPMFWGGGAGSHASQFYPIDTDYPLVKGDLIRFEGGGTYRGYWADTGGMAVIGQMDDRQERMSNAIARGAEVAHTMIRPGVNPDAVCSAVLEAIRSSGLPDFPSSNAWGHGIGLSLNEAPRVRPGSPTVLEPGMVLCFETPYFELGWGGLQAEDTFLVTANGCELLTQADRAAWILGGNA